MEKFKLQIPTTVFFGTGEFVRIKKAAKETGKNALIVTGQGSVKKYGYLDKLKSFLDEEKITYTVFEGIEPNPRSTTINRAAKIAREAKVDMVIALGGGSVMDAAKGIAVSAKSGQDVWDYCDYAPRNAKPILEILPIICIPTLAATGSEVDGVAVITNFEIKRKAAIHNAKTTPKFAIIDPELTMTVPTNYIIDGAVDIIAHCIETYASSKDDTKVPDYITLALVRSVKEAVDELIKDPESLSAREELCWASSMAMMKLFSGRNGGWPAHLIEHALSAIYDVSHGLGLAWIIPSVLKFSMQHNKEKILKLIGFTLHGDIKHYTDGEQAINDLKAWLTKIGALRDLKKCGIDKISIEAVAQVTLDTSANSEGYIYGAAPMYEKDIIWVLQDAFNK